MKFTLSIIVFVLTVTQSGCIPVIYPPGLKTNHAQLSDNLFLTEDGAHLPLRRWLPSTTPRAIIIALHGFNDYSHFFEQPGSYLSRHGIASFAYDQRGFGMAPRRGLWAGTDAYIHDLRSFVRLVKRRYPNSPLFLLGESMGGAVAIAAIHRKPMVEVEGLILASPALWARSTMPWYQTGLLWLLSHTVPWMTFTGESLHIMASDNIDMLIALGRDPSVIKETRIDAVNGLTDLMDEAFEGSASLPGPTLLLYGEKDEIVPKEAIYAFVQRLLTKDPSEKTVAIYPSGYHLLLRDLHASTAWQDIAAWMEAEKKKLPSGADVHAHRLLIENARDL